MLWRNLEKSHEIAFTPKSFERSMSLRLLQIK